MTDDLLREHEEFAFDDAAYLLGALEPADRVAYERHLQRCELCQASLAEVAGLPAVLDRVSVAELAEEPVPDTVLPRLLREVRQQRRTRTVRTAGASLLAACVLAALIVTASIIYRGSNQPTALALHPVAANPAGVHATITLRGEDSHPRIQLDCGYQGLPGSYGQPVSYRMLVVNQAGVVRDLGSWSPQPGEDVELVRDSPWNRAALARVQIADGQGTVLLQVSL